MFEQGMVAVAGPRSLPKREAERVAEVAHVLVAAGHQLVVGCATGADACVVAVVPPAACSVLAAFGPGGQGGCRWSNVAGVSRFAEEGGVVSWWAGGGAGAPLPARLSARTGAVVATASVGLVVFVGPESRGSVLACRRAVARGLPVLAFPVGGAALPSVNGWQWQPVSGAGVWSGAFRCVPSQSSLF